MVVTGLAISATAFAADPRLPQVPVEGSELQAHLTDKDGGINVSADQLNIQRWKTTVTGNSTLTLHIEKAVGAANNAIGVYNAADAAPDLFQIFPATASAGWFAVASFRSAPDNKLIVNLFDQDGNLDGTVIYTNVTTNDFGYYIKHEDDDPGFSQDYRNYASEVRALTFQGTGDNAGCWWLCFEDKNAADPDADSDYDDAIVFLESVNPTPVTRATWAAVKDRFR